MRQVRVRSAFYCAFVCALLLSCLPACASGSTDATSVLEPVRLLNSLNLELDSVAGTKVWCLGIYGDTRYSDLGIGFLVSNHSMLLVSTEMDPLSYAVLDGALPPASDDGAEILVYGTVSEFGKARDVFVAHPTPLITVEKYHVLNREVSTGPWEDIFLPAAAGGLSALLAPSQRVGADDAPEGTKAAEGDRALIIGGGVDAVHNHAHYAETIKRDYLGLKALGYTPEQIRVVYNDGADIPLETGDSIETERATTQTIGATVERYAQEMEPGSVLDIFITGCGDGFYSFLGYSGQPIALPGTQEYDRGLTYPENESVVDASKLAYQDDVIWTTAGDGPVYCFALWLQQPETEADLGLFRRKDSRWVHTGQDENRDGRVTETETNLDIDGDGDIDNFGWSKEDPGPWQFLDATFDSDHDGEGDVRVAWDAPEVRYLIERFQDGSWYRIGEDTNGDFIIDGADGGVDWNLDGDTNDRVGFHEGIRLWGSGVGSVLWDDEFAAMLKPLGEHGIQISVVTTTSFGGGLSEYSSFPLSLDTLAYGGRPGIFNAIAGEDTLSWSRHSADRPGLYNPFEKAFIENLRGIDDESWDYAFDKAREADEKAFKDQGLPATQKNEYTAWRIPLLPTDSIVAHDGGEYDLVLRLPPDLEGKVFDLEVLWGLQKPRWATGKVVELPVGYGWEAIPGGVRVKSTEAFPVTPLLMKLQGSGGDGRLKVQLTDRDHAPIGYVSPQPTDALPEPDEVLQAELYPHVDAGWSDNTCTGTIDVDFSGLDLSGGEAPIARVVLKGNTEIWHDSGAIEEIHYPGSASKEVPCGHEYVLVLEVTNIFGQVATREAFVKVPTPPQRQEWTPPPFIPALTPPTDMPAQTILQAALAVSGKSVRSGEACTSTVTISYDGTDLTGGTYPVTRVVMTVNGTPYDSGPINTKQYHHSVTIPATCGQTFHIAVTATNSIGKSVTTSGTYTTPVP